MGINDIKSSFNGIIKEGLEQIKKFQETSSYDIKRSSEWGSPQTEEDNNLMNTIGLQLKRR